jgi:hypothetical protein
LRRPRRARRRRSGSVTHRALAAPCARLLRFVPRGGRDRDLDLDIKCVDDLAGCGCDPGGADDRGDRGEDAADLLGIDTDLAGGVEVQQIGDRRGIDGDQRGDAESVNLFEAPLSRNY